MLRPLRRRAPRRRKLRGTGCLARRPFAVEALEARVLLSAVPFSEQPDIANNADGAFSVFAADLDGDGDLDTLSASALDDTIAWYENTAGDGSAWTPQTISSTALGARSVHAADVDGDGDLDVLSASEDDDTIAWYENTAGDGSAWTARTITSAADGAYSVFAADVDGDGDLDVLSASTNDDTIAWYENTAGDGTAWTVRTITIAVNHPNSVFAADVDGDGDLDAMSSSLLDDRIAWYENTAGDGTAWTARSISTAADGAHSVFAADVDGDGDLDALSASLYDNKIAWYENTAGDGTAWTPRTISTAATGALSVFAADVDGDGDVDALSASGTDDKIAWYDNTAGDGTAWTPRTLTTAADGAASVFAADIDHDGDLDVLSASYFDDTIAWHENQQVRPDPVFASPIGISTAADGAYSVFAADVDGDGDLDAVSASYLDDRIAWYENTAGDGTSWTARTISTAADGAASVFAADVDGDGDLDVLSASYLDDKIAWYENTAGDGTSWTARTISTAADGAASVFAADVDGDGDLDVVSASSLDDKIAWYENTAGNGTSWTARTISTAADGAASVFAADVDGDGDLDVVSASYLDDKIAWYENTAGNGTSWTARTISTAADGAASVFAADVDGDGDLDVVSASYLDDKIAWYENTAGDGSAWTPRVISIAANGARSVFVADVDRDGDLDVLSVSSLDHKIAWYENTAGNGTTWTPHVIWTAANGARSVFAADVDRDGDPDVLSASLGDDKIAWYENRAGDEGGDDTVGLFDPVAGTFFLNNSHSPGAADLTFRFGPAGAGWTPLAGNWDAAGGDSVALFDPVTGTFFLNNGNVPGAADGAFRYGPAGGGWTPLGGNWDGAGGDSAGLFDPVSGTFFFRNSNTPGVADLTVRFGPAGAGWTPVVGDWDGDGTDTVGLFNPVSGTFFFRNSNTPGVADLTVRFGPAGAGWTPVVGDWNGDGTDTVGLFDPVAGIFFLKNTNAPGAADFFFRYGPAGAGWTPVVGDWNGDFSVFAAAQVAAAAETPDWMQEIAAGRFDSSVMAESLVEASSPAPARAKRLAPLPSGALGQGSFGAEAVDRVHGLFETSGRESQGPVTVVRGSEVNSEVEQAAWDAALLQVLDELPLAEDLDAIV